MAAELVLLDPKPGPEHIAERCGRWQLALGLWRSERVAGDSAHAGGTVGTMAAVPRGGGGVL